MPGGYNLALFASDKGPGNAERASIMQQAGSYLARKGARLICPVVGGGVLAMPLIKSARAAGGQVSVLAPTGFNAPAALADSEIERFGDTADLYRRLDSQADAFIGLPGSLASVTQLFQAWVETGSVKPVALLNRNKAFEPMRGLAVDVLVHSARNWEKKLLIADSIEDLWNRLPRLLHAN